MFTQKIRNNAARHHQRVCQLSCATSHPYTSSSRPQHRCIASTSPAGIRDLCNSFHTTSITKQSASGRHRVSEWLKDRRLGATPATIAQSHLVPQPPQSVTRNLSWVNTRTMSSLSSLFYSPLGFEQSRQEIYSAHPRRTFSTLSPNNNKEEVDVDAVESVVASPQSLRDADDVQRMNFLRQQLPPSYTRPQVVSSPNNPDAQFAVFLDKSEYRKLKPSVVRKRLAKMRTYEGAEKNIRHSPWRLNLVCQMVAGLPLQEALTQLEFNKKWAAPLVQKVLRRTANLADIRDNLQVSQLEVAECFATRGTPLKRVKTMGRGRAGRMEHKHSHMRVVLREIDFRLRIYQAPSLNQKKKWFQLQQEAERDAARAKAKREEMERLEKETSAASAAKGKA